MRTDHSTDYYAVLGVRPDADLVTIRRAYRAAVRHAHPDGRPEGDATRAHDDMVRINQAWEILSDPAKRADYDASTTSSAGSRPKPPPPPPPPAPRRALWTPPAVDFGVAFTGQRSAERVVTVRFEDGSTIRRATVLDESGLFWFVGPAEFRDVSEVTLYLYSQRIPTDAPIGVMTDQLRVQLDEVMASITLTAQLAEPIRKPAAPKPSPPPTRQGARARRGYRYWARCVVAVLVLVLAVAVGVMASNVLSGIGGGSGDQAALPTASAGPNRFCSVPSDDGQVLSYYATVPGTTTKTGVELWESSPQRKADPWVDWWTPDFPYWERANKHHMTVNGQLYKPYERIEIDRSEITGWQSLSGFFVRNGLDSKAEAAGRQSFLGGWVDQLSAPECK
ncbi:J domain-containing protein [Kitasatospora sp. NPDC049285]|uniref:J domain-containing protein n=1 Tax=Kitasatospora sp. NPDC049285 TaxID=3157096 RepID=UPI003423BC70